MRIPRSRRLTRRLLVFVTGLGILLTASPPAGAATVIRVNKNAANCSDAGPGTVQRPLCTISAGAARAVAGDTVLVAAGVYTEQVDVPRSGTATNPIVLAAVSGASVTVRGRNHGFQLSSRSWVTIRGFRIVDTADHGIAVTGGSHLTIVANEVAGAGRPVDGATGRGISLSSTTTSIVERNRTHHNSDAGVFIGTGATGNYVARNASWNNARGFVRAATGIDVRASSNTVTRNITFDNEDSGINIWNGANGCLVSNNVSYRNGDHGIDNKASNNTRIRSNTVYGGVDSGIEVVGSTGVSLANNISANNGIDSPRTEGNIRVDEASAPSISLDYDLVFLSSPGVMIDFNDVEYGSLAAFRAATGREVHGLQANPRFRRPSLGNFHLTPGSRAIDSANSGVSGHPKVDADARRRVDDPDTPNTGVGPRRYDDRGAFEFHPK
jgi:hypothetical protein